jgi:protein-S-isoprenylcysteine O-methyltransferase Ste14
MREAALVIMIHQLLYQGIFFVKNIALRHKLGRPFVAVIRRPFVLIHLMILREEQYLASLHTRDYERYCRRVPRYLLQ